MNHEGRRIMGLISAKVVLVLLALMVAPFQFGNLPGKWCQARDKPPHLPLSQTQQEELSRRYQAQRERALRQLREMGYDLHFESYAYRCGIGLISYVQEPIKVTGWGLVPNRWRDKFYPMEQFASALRCFPELRYLNVSTEECWDDSLGDLIVQANPDIKWLSLLGVIGTKTAKQLTTLKSLEVVEIRARTSDAKISEELMRYIARIPNLRALRIVTVQGNLTVKGLWELTKAPRLEVFALVLEHSYQPRYRGPGVPRDPPEPDPVVPDQVFHEMADALAAMPRLKSLYVDFSRGFFDTRVDDRFVAKLSQSRSIKGLDLGSGAHTKVTDESARHLACMKQLEALGTHRSSISDQGVKYLATLPNLRALDLYGAKAITDLSVESFCRMKSLVYIELIGTGMTKVGIDAVNQHIQKKQFEQAPGESGSKGALPDGK